MLDINELVRSNNRLKYPWTTSDSKVLGTRHSSAAAWYNSKDVFRRTYTPTIDLTPKGAMSEHAEVLEARVEATLNQSYTHNDLSPDVIIEDIIELLSETEPPSSARKYRQNKKIEIPSATKADALIGYLVAHNTPDFSTPALPSNLTRIIELLGIQAARSNQRWSFGLDAIDAWISLLLSHIQDVFSPALYEEASKYFREPKAALEKIIQPLAEEIRQGHSSEQLIKLAFNCAGPTLSSALVKNAPQISDDIHQENFRDISPHILAGLVKRPDTKPKIIDLQRQLVEKISWIPATADPFAAHAFSSILRTIDQSGMPLSEKDISVLTQWAKHRSERRHYESLSMIPSFTASISGSQTLSASLDRDVLLRLFKHAPPGQYRLRALGHYIKYYHAQQPDFILDAFSSNPNPPTKQEVALLLTHPKKEYRINIAGFLASKKIKLSGPTI